MKTKSYRGEVQKQQLPFLVYGGEMDAIDYGVGVSTGTVSVGWKHFHIRTYYKLSLPVPYTYLLQIILPLHYPYPLWLSDNKTVAGK